MAGVLGGERERVELNEWQNVGVFNVLSACVCQYVSVFKSLWPISRSPSPCVGLLSLHDGRPPSQLLCGQIVEGKGRVLGCHPIVWDKLSEPGSMPSLTAGQTRRQTQEPSKDPQWTSQPVHVSSSITRQTSNSTVVRQRRWVLCGACTFLCLDAKLISLRLDIITLSAASIQTALLKCDKTDLCKYNRKTDTFVNLHSVFCVKSSCGINFSYTF